MRWQDAISGRQLAASATAGALLAAVLFASAAFSQSRYVVSQKGREFNPGALSIARGESVLIVNDDADLRHHVYIDSDKFNFDSGDQEPGTKTSILFPTAGTFKVLCAIHPKMRLVVTVH